MFLRSAPEITVTDLAEQLESSGRQSLHAMTDGIRAHLDTDRRFIEVEDTQIFLSGDEGLKALAGWLDVPTKFLSRLDPDLAQNLVQSMLSRSPNPVSITWDDNGLESLNDPTKEQVDPRSLVQVAGRVITPEAPVVEWRKTAAEFALDVIAPEDFDRGIGGDPQVGDITAGGLRFGQDLKNNLAPFVQPYFYRLACTNGYETFDPGLRVDARGQSVMDVLAEIEEAAQRAFGRIEEDIANFYTLRNEPVDNPERTILRVAEEQGLPNRTALTLAEQVPAVIGDDGASMFDLVNLVTNQANDPAMRRRAGARRKLEQAGGAVITEHAERCHTCNHILGAR